MLDARRRLCRLLEALQEADGRRAVEILTAHVQVHEQNRVDVVAEPHVVHVAQAAHEQSRAHEEHDRQGALEHEQRGARLGSVDGTFARARLQVGGEISAVGLEYRREAGNQTYAQGDGKCEHDGAWIVESGRSLALVQHYRPEHGAAPVGDHQH